MELERDLRVHSFSLHNYIFLGGEEDKRQSFVDT